MRATEDEWLKLGAFGLPTAVAIISVESSIKVDL